MSVRARAWTALLLPAFTWFAFEQGLSAVLHSACGRVTTGVAWGALSLVLCGLALRIAWPLARRSGEVDADLWLARMAMLGAAFFGLAIVFQTLAILLVPACVR
jgi:hypothetical protein